MSNAIMAGGIEAGRTRRVAALESLSSVATMLRSLATLLVFQSLGEGVSYFLGLPVPGPVIGMLLLLGFLSVRPQVAQAIEPTALELLRHLSLLFVPAGVGIMVAAQAVSGDILAVAASTVVSTTMAVAVTALVTRTLLNRQRRISKMQEPTS